METGEDRPATTFFLNFRFRYNWWEVVHWSLSLEGCVCCVGKVLAAALHAKSNGFLLHYLVVA